MQTVIERDERTVIWSLGITLLQQPLHVRVGPDLGEQAAHQLRRQHVRVHAQDGTAQAQSVRYQHHLPANHHVDEAGRVEGRIKFLAEIFFIFAIIFSVMKQ